ncbi:MAG: aspartate kinase [Candidatus Tectomicrobia bacterium]|nr:aspartate kinase [Candidatus Tectomicrobia bacterium]
MRIIVQKYGGTSVGDVERIKMVARKSIQALQRADGLVVVVSAMAGETNKLVDLAHQINPRADERELDMLLSTGERVTIALLAMAIQALGYQARSFTGRQVGIVTDSTYTKARIKRVECDHIMDLLRQGTIAVVAGFQGIDEKQQVTTLGRGGSDLTAVALAAALKADICEIYTDVDGVYTTDPSIEPKARRLSRISHDEMLEMASLGAKVLQARCVEFAKRHNVPLVVKSTFEEGEGTLITREDADMEQVVVAGVACSRDLARITLHEVADRPGIAARIFNAIAAKNIVVDMIIQNISEHGLTDISFTVPRSEGRRALELLAPVVEEIGAAETKLNETIARVSIVGLGIRSHQGVAAKMFEALSREGINILMISTSEIKISCVIEEAYMERAVRALHAAFELDREPTAVRARAGTAGTAR